MNFFWNIFDTSIYLAFSISILWFTSLTMVDEREIGKYLPFVLLGFLLCFKSAFVFYGLFNTIVWVVLESVYPVVFVWILINLKRGDQNGSV